MVHRDADPLINVLVMKNMMAVAETERRETSVVQIWIIRISLFSGHLLT